MSQARLNDHAVLSNTKTQSQRYNINSANVMANRNFKIRNKLKSFFEIHKNLNCTLGGSLERETEHLTTDCQEK
jgi:hypothetical protein